MGLSFGEGSGTFVRVYEGACGRGERGKVFAIGVSEGAWGQQAGGESVGEDMVDEGDVCGEDERGN